MLLSITILKPPWGAIRVFLPPAPNGLKFLISPFFRDTLTEKLVRAATDYTAELYCYYDCINFSSIDATGLGLGLIGVL